VGAQQAPLRRARVLIADDYWLFRQMVRGLLEGEGDFHVTGEAASLQESVHLARYYPPDVIVMGVRMLAARQEAGKLSRWPVSPWGGARVVAVGDADLPEYADLAKKHGAVAYLGREGLSTTLVSTLRALRPVIPPEEGEDTMTHRRVDQAH